MVENGEMKKGVLLDVDGTIVESNDAHAQAWVDAFQQFECDVSYNEVRLLIGMGGDKLVPKVVPDIDPESEKGVELSKKRSEIFLEKYAPTLVPTPGAREFIEYLLSQNISIVIATSAKEEELKVLLKKAEVDDLLTEWTSSSDVEQS